MNKRLAFVLKMLLILALPTLFALLALRADSSGESDPLAATKFEGALRPNSIPAADFGLLTQDGKAFPITSTR